MSQYGRLGSIYKEANVFPEISKENQKMGSPDLATLAAFKCPGHSPNQVNLDPDGETKALVFFNALQMILTYSQV